MAATAKAPAKPRRIEAFPYQNAMIGKVKVGQVQARLDEESYRAVLLRVTGKASSTACTKAELEAMIAELTRLGAYRQPKAARRSKRADSPTARKARALWISLHQLGAVEDGRESALEAFAKRQLGVDRLAWAKADQMDSIIEALVGIAARHGWKAKGKLDAQKGSLVEALFAKLNTDGRWTLDKAVHQICGMTPVYPDLPRKWTAHEQDVVIAAFARLLKTGKKD